MVYLCRLISNRNKRSHIPTQIISIDLLKSQEALRPVEPTNSTAFIFSVKRNLKLFSSFSEVAAHSIHTFEIGQAKVSILANFLFPT